MTSPLLAACHGFQTALTAALLLAIVPTAASAAAFKCMVGGRTIYQQSPCNTSADDPAAQSQPGAAPSANDMAKRRVRVVDEGTPLAQEAFRLLVAGQVDAYVANLCTRERRGNAGAAAKSALRNTGADLAQRKVTLGRVTDTSAADLSFVALEDLAGHQDSSKPIRTVKVTASFDWELGKICLRSLSLVELH